MVAMNDDTLFPPLSMATGSSLHARTSKRNSKRSRACRGATSGRSTGGRCAGGDRKSRPEIDLFPAPILAGATTADAAKKSVLGSARPSLEIAGFSISEVEALMPTPLAPGDSVTNTVFHKVHVPSVASACLVNSFVNSESVQDVIQHSKMRSVRFDLSTLVIHEIPPYEDIYGVHPSLFDFDRCLRMVPPVTSKETLLPFNCFDSHSDDEEEDDEGWVLLRRYQVQPGQN